MEFYKLGSTPTPLPKILGHENSGVVCEVGEEVTGFKAGDRVLCDPPAHCAEDCPSCRKGLTNICVNGFPQTAGIGVPDGGYAKYLLIRDVAHTMILHVPDNVKPEDAVLFDVICVTLHGIRMSRFKIGDAVVVSGVVTDIMPLEECKERGLGRKDRGSQLKMLIQP
ncbi:MAG: alcohol dehydrogenase catalytic domain-containing protein [Clostridiales bacterium]|nr:alcohol dehydrogenase catalytic domain-containing protein [Clostridiales bacterium]